MPGPSVLLCFGLLFILPVPLKGRTYNYVVINDKIEDGRDGKCPSSNSARSISQLCVTGWRTHNQTNGPQMTLSSNSQCIYFIKTMIQNCLGRGAAGTLQSEICVRKRRYYYMSASCMRKWLDWQPCDKECGGGLERRYKFFKFGTIKYYEFESRACNSHACPKWTPWQPSPAGCDVNCTRMWTRSCRNTSGIVNASLCAGNDVQGKVRERRPCYVSECANFAPLKPPTAIPSTTLTTTSKKRSSTFSTTSTTPTTTSTTLTLSTSTSQDSTSTSKTSTSTSKSVALLPGGGRNFNPGAQFNLTRPVLKSPNGEVTIKTESEDSKALVWIGVLVGLLAFCILVLLTYIGMQKYRKGKLSALPFRFQTSAAQGASGTSGRGENPRATNQYHTSSIDRLIARVRALQQMATVRRNSPSSVYLQPDVPPGPRRGDSIVSHQQQNGTPRARTVSFAENAAPYSSVPGGDEPQNADDPIYADIPAYRNSVSADDFTSDSDFDQLDEEPLVVTSTPLAPRGRMEQPRAISGSFVARQDPGGFVRSQLRRCETERRGALHDDSRRLGGVRPAPRPQPKRSSLPNYMRHGVAPGSSGWNREFGEFGKDSPHKPLKRRSGMGSVAESSLENLSNLAASETHLPGHSSRQTQNHVGGDSTIYLQPNTSQCDRVTARAREPIPPQPTVEPGSCRRSSPTTSPPHPDASSKGYAGAYNASHEFGFQRTPSESRSARNSSASAHSISESEVEYREPIDSQRPKVEEATYNLPFGTPTPS